MAMLKYIIVENIEGRQSCVWNRNSVRRDAYVHLSVALLLGSCVFALHF